MTSPSRRARARGTPDPRRIIGVDARALRRAVSISVGCAISVGGAIAGCSAIVAPNTRRLGGGVDAGAPPGADAFVERPDAAGPPADMIPSNVDPAILGAGVRDLVIDVAATFDTSACMATMADARVLRQSDGTELCALIVHDARIGPAGTLRVTGARPLVIIASSEVVIEGTLDVSARHVEPGPGGGLGGAAGRPEGRGPAGGLAGRWSGMLDDAGGGGGGLCGAGGSGGQGGMAEGGFGGRGSTTTLEPLLAGSGGGLGFGGARPVPNGNHGPGGAGGGAVQVSARVAIRVRGSVLAGGGGGASGEPNDAYTNWGAGGGGGSGGAILLEAPILELGAGAAILASGGGGGSGSSRGQAPARGNDGRDFAVRAPGGMGAGEYGASGGAAGGGAEPAGLGGSSNTVAGGNGGGGGGGVGCVVLRAGGGAIVPAGTRLSPSGPGLSTLPIRVR